MMQDRNILWHTVLSFVFRGGGILANLMMVPLALDMLDSTRYGIWLSIGAVMTWFNFLDVGLGNGLRNQVASAIAQNDTSKIKGLFSTAFWSISALVVVLEILILFSFPLVPWQVVFNTNLVSSSELSAVMVYVTSGFLLGIVLKLTMSMYLAHQFHSIQAMVNGLIQVGSYVAVYALVLNQEHSLLVYAQALSVVPVVVLLGISIWAFASRFKIYWPRFSAFSKGYVRETLGLGMGFVVVQLMWMLITTTDSYCIAYWFSPAEVVPFSVSFKYFGVINIGFVLVMTPYWSAFTKAHAEGDADWMKKAQQRIQKMVLGFSLLGVVLLIIAPWMIELWMSGQVEIGYRLHLAMLVFSLLYMYLGSKNYILNGLGKLKVQMRVLAITALLHIVLSYYLGVVLEWGVEGVIWGTNISIAINVLVSGRQLDLINRKKAQGIWNA